MDNRKHDRSQSRHPPRPDARFFFAAERTFLSWVRTGVAVMAIGFVVAKFTLFLDELANVRGLRGVHPSGAALFLGAVITALGGILIFVAAYRFLRQRQALISTKDLRPSATLDLALAGLLVLIAFLLLVYLLRSVI
jgi:putative membrane protein